MTMKCPICSAEIETGALSCPTCRAFQSVERTPLGVVAGWVGILAGVLTIMLLVLPITLLFAGSLEGFPWVLPAIGVCVTGAGLWYSHSTKHLVWIAPRKPE